jgi:hypothetical protein
MPDRLEYQVTLQKDGRFDTYETASVFAFSDDEAVQKAKDWVHSFGLAHQDAWLLVAEGGKDIATLRPGEF